MSFIQWLLGIVLTAAVLWFTAQAVLTTYFRKKEEFVNRLIQKGRGSDAEQ